MRIRTAVVSADDEARQYLEQSAVFTDSKMEVVACLSSGEELISSFEELDPQLVIVDRDLPQMDAQTCIRKIRDLECSCRILPMGRAQDADFMRSMLRMKVQGYLEKPLLEDNLRRELRSMSEEIRGITPERIDYDADISMQSLYFWKMMFEKSELSSDMTFINLLTHSRFHAGSYRVVLVRIDHYEGDLPDFAQKDYYHELHRIQQYIKFSLSEYLYEYCYEILCDLPFNGVLTILNYDPDMDSKILDQFDSILDDTYKFAVLNYGMTVTVCVGGSHPDISEVSLSLNEAYEVSWSRIRQGTGRVLYYHGKYNAQNLYYEQLENLVEELNLTAETLDVEGFHRVTEELFALPDYVLSDGKYREALIGYVDRFFDINAAALSRHMGVEQEKGVLMKELNFSSSPELYKRNLTARFDEYYDLLREDSEKQSLRQLRKAIKYIKDNYGQPLTLELLAEKVNLNPVYFSHLFRKNMGVRLTDYIAEYRIDRAKEMLFETDMTIYEIASAVGFQDQRYFSKRFRQLVGMTPTEYRKQR